MILILFDKHFEQLKQRGTLLNYLINIKNVYKLSKNNIGQLDNYINKYNIKIIIQFCVNISSYINIDKKINKHYVYILDNQYFNTSTIKNIILPYKNKLIVNSSYPDKNILNFKSRYFDNKVFKDHKLEKKYDILIYGTRNFPYNILNNENLQVIINYKKDYKKKINKECPNKIDFYELRTKLENILIKYRHKYNIRILDNGKNITSYPITGENLSKLINQSYMTVCCSSVCDLLFYKHLEIPASNSVILGDYPSDYEETFKDNIVKIDKFMSEEEIINKIDEALSDKKSLLEKSQKLHDIIHKEHCLENSIEDFKNIIDKIQNTK